MAIRKGERYRRQALQLMIGGAIAVLFSTFLLWIDSATGLLDSAPGIVSPILSFCALLLGAIGIFLLIGGSLLLLTSEGTPIRLNRR